MKRAKLLLSMKHGLARLDNVWGVGGGQRPVLYLINKVVILFQLVSYYHLTCCVVDEAVVEGVP